MGAFCKVLNQVSLSPSSLISYEQLPQSKLIACPWHYKDVLMLLHYLLILVKPAQNICCTNVSSHFRQQSVQYNCTLLIFYAALKLDRQGLRLLWCDTNNSVLYVNWPFPKIHTNEYLMYIIMGSTHSTQMYIQLI